METFRRVFAQISRAGNIIAGLFVALITLMMVVEIIGRRLFNAPIPGSFEIVAGAMAVLTTIGFAFALEQGRHIRCTLIPDHLGAKAQDYALLVAHLVGFIVAGILSWMLVLSARDSLAIGEIADSSIYIPIYVPKVIFAFATILFTLAFLIRFIDDVRERGIKGS